MTMNVRHFKVDRSRIIHCAAFRRLQGKTQIFGIVHDNFFRTRLTHSLEVAQIAKGIALICGANPELVEAISLAHDIGHPPLATRESGRSTNASSHSIFASRATHRICARSPRSR